MSTIAGILRLDGGAVDVGELRRLLASFAHRASDRSAMWANETIGLGAQMWHTTSESVTETQPHHDTDSGLSLVFDGRLDNRDELRERIRQRRDFSTATSDAQLLAAAYLQWGTDCACHLLGDFAFAIWDRRVQRLCCSRDIIGLRPFYFRSDRARFVWASESHALLRYDGTTPMPDEAMVAEHLTVVQDKARTLLSGVTRLPPAHTLVVDSGGVRQWKYWDVEPGRTIRYADQREYVEHLRALITDAVRARMRAPSPFAVMLSGGLDSSTVLAVAQRESANQAAAYSIAVDGPENEATYFQQVAEHVGARLTVVVADRSRQLPLAEEASRYLDLPGSPNAAVATPLHDRARDDGVRVLLTGLGADEWLGGSQHHYADQFSGGQWWTLLRGMRADAARGSFPGWRRAARLTLWPLVAAPAQRHVRRLLRRPAVPPWIRADFARRVGLAERLATPVPDPGFPTCAQYDMYREASSGWDAYVYEMLDRASSAAGVEHRHPFYDRRIIEFGIAIPESVRWHRGERKHVLRCVADGLVPAAIRNRLRSADYSPTLVHALEAHGGAALFRSLGLSEQGWVDGARVLAMYDDMARRFQCGDPAYRRHLWTLWTIFVVDVWFTTAILGAPQRPLSRATV